MRSSHCTAAALAAILLTVAGRALAAPPAQATTFTVFLQGTAIGTEEVTLTRTPEAITISGIERIGPPIRMTVSSAEVRYSPDWRPLACHVEGHVRDEPVLIRTSVQGTSAVTDYTQGAKSFRKTDPVAADTLLLPNIFFGAYEAMAARLSGAKAGDRVDIYVPPLSATSVPIRSVSSDRIRTQAALVEVTRYELEFTGPAGPAGIELWADPAGRLLRLSIPAQGFDIIRSDLASITSRRESAARPNDESVNMPANGFSLTGTLSRPEGTPAAGARLPAVVLVSGSAATDRDETLGGVPIFGQLASSLADAGFIVVRYDKRGVGQSGGRSENTTLEDYAEDAAAAVRFLERRRDVDRRRIALVGYGEGGAVAAVAASRTGAVAALALVSAPGTTGDAFVLEQQEHLLDLTKVTGADRAAKIELQQRLHKAVLTGKGLDQLPADLRRSADTPWFRSFLAYDPARVIRKCDQPILIVQGGMDRETAPVNADRLEGIAKARKGRAGQAVRMVKLPALNHLLLPAPTGEVSEYDHLAARAIAPEVAASVGAWLKDSMGAR